MFYEIARHARRAAIAAAVFGVVSLTYADADAAKGYVKEAVELIGSNDLDSAASKLELAEAELDGVDAAAKAPIEASIKEAKARITAAKSAADKPKYLRKLDRALREAEGAIGNLVIWAGAEREFNDVVNDEAAKAVIPDEIAAAQKKFATFKKLNAKKSAAAKAEQLEQRVKYVEDEWKEYKPAFEGDSPNAKDRAIERMGDHLKRANEELSELDASEEPIKSLKARVDVVAADFSKIALADKVKEQVETLNRKVELYKDDWDGWDKETTGPTWKDFRSQSTGAMGRLLMPKTAELISRFGDLLENLKESEDYQLVASAPEVQAVIDKVKKSRETAVEKVTKAASAIVDEAEKAGVNDDDGAFGRLKDAVRLTLGDDSEPAKALIARMEKKIADHEAATTGAEEAKNKLITDLRAKAEEVWPKLYEGMPYETEIDLPNQVGKPIGFLADNLMGYRFKPGDYYFATTLGGVPVAAKIDPALKKQIDETEKAIGRSLGDDDGDGKWDCIAIVTDKKVKLLAKRQAEASGTVDGQQVTATIDYAEPVDAVVIEIIAAKCGPFAGVKDRGVLKTDGTVGK